MLRAKGNADWQRERPFLNACLPTIPGLPWDVMRGSTAAPVLPSPSGEKCEGRLLIFLPFYTIEMLTFAAACFKIAFFGEQRGAARQNRRIGRPRRAGGSLVLREKKAV